MGGIWQRGYYEHILRNQQDFDEAAWVYSKQSRSASGARDRTMKKTIRRILLVLLILLLLWIFFPRPFQWILPQRMVRAPGEGAEIRAETEFTASRSFGIDQEVLDAFYDLHCEMESVRFLADPLSLLPILCQPQEPVQVKIDYFQEGCSSTSNCRTTLLWDGDTLWVNWLGGHYLGYWPTDPAEFEAAIQRLTLEYGGTGTVTS